MSQTPHNVAASPTAASSSAGNFLTPEEPPELQPTPPDLITPQFTVRAIATGMVLGGLLSASNIYTGLKVGWSFNMSTNAVVISLGFWLACEKLFGLRRYNILENNIGQTAASSGANVSSAGLVAPIPALTLLTGTMIPWHWLWLWVFSVCIVGIVTAVAVRRQMIVVDRLRFASGIATAQTLREVYGRGAEAIWRVSVLASAAFGAAVVKLVEARWHIPKLSLRGTVGGFSLKSLMFQFDVTLLMYGLGALVGLRACASLLLGSILAWGVLAPRLIESGNIRLEVSEPLEALPDGVVLPPQPESFMRFDQRRKQLAWSGPLSAAERDAFLAQSPDPAYQTAVTNLFARAQNAGASDGAAPNFRDCVSWLLWPGVTCMVVASLTSLAFAWRPILAGLGLLKHTGPDSLALAPDPTDVPKRWFLSGMTLVLVLSVALQVSLFSIAWWAAVLGVLVTFILTVVAGRVAGETNITPVGALGKVTQLMFGALAPGQAAPNLMAANVTGGAASQAADLLHDLKTGWLIGAQARLQAGAQVLGALAGALAGSAIYLILFPNPQEQLITKEWAAPAVVTWKAVAELFMVGFRAIPEGTPIAMAIAAAVAVVLAVADKLLPTKARTFVPSAASIGLAFTIQPFTCMSMFVGAAIAALLSKVAPTWSGKFVIIICAGIVAGETLTGVAYALAEVLTPK